MADAPERSAMQLIKNAVEGKASGKLNDRGYGFLDIPKDQPAVFLHAKHFLDSAEVDRLAKGSIIVFDLWGADGKFEARQIRIKSDPILSESIRGVVTEWPWTYGYVDIGGDNDSFAHESALVDCSYLSSGDVVSVNLDSDNCIARLERTGEWSPEGLSHYEQDLEMGDPKMWIRALLDIAGSDERWDVRGRPESSILRSYFKYTYLRQRETAGHLVISGAKMCWNTGLMDRNGDDVLAEFRRTLHAEVKVGPVWKWIKFLTVADRAATEWRDAPRAKYWDNPADLIYDTDKGYPTVQSEHIGDRDDRFPEHMRTWPRQDIVRAVQEAAREAVKRVLQNYKTAIPQFYRADSGRAAGSIQLLLPLRFPGQPRPSLALAVRRDGDSYYAATVLKIEWAYTYARLLTKPDTEWLNPFE